MWARFRRRWRRFERVIGYDPARAEEHFLRSGVDGFVGEPHLVLLELTSRCNLRCVMCAINEDPRLQEGGAWHGDLPEALFDRMRPAFSHIRKVALNGHGESLLHRQFVPYLREIKARGGSVELTTNLTLLTEEAARAMVESGMDDLVFSIHAATPERYARIMGGAKIERTLAKLAQLNDLKKRHRSRFPRLVFQFVAMRENIEELPRLVGLAGEMGAEQVTVLALTEYERVKGESLVHHPDLVRRWIPAAQEAAWRARVRLNLPQAYADLARDRWPARPLADRARIFLSGLVDPEASKRKASRVFGRAEEILVDRAVLRSSAAAGNRAPIRDCFDPWTFSFVLQNGDIRPCCVMERKMGNVMDASFLDIWRGPEYARLRREFVSDAPPPECRGCQARGWTERHRWMIRFRLDQAERTDP